jgi:hypothetical protein
LKGTVEESAARERIVMPKYQPLRVMFVYARV